MKKIDEMNYVDLLSFVNEVNRAPGGKRSISQILRTVNFKTQMPRILEIGSNTGFTSIEISKQINASIIGIDVNKNAVNQANSNLNLEDESVQSQVRFMVGDAANIPFEDGYFDLVITGGATTFVNEDDRKRAVSEYRRVLKPNGYLAVTNLFYWKPVPHELLDELQTILGFQIQPWTRNYWMNLFLESDMEIFSYDEKKMKNQNKDVVEEYSKRVVFTSPNVLDLSANEQSEIYKRWTNIMNIFNENHKYLAYMLVIFRNNTVKEQEELFFEEGAINTWGDFGDEKWK